MSLESALRGRRALGKAAFWLVVILLGAGADARSDQASPAGTHRTIIAEQPFEVDTPDGRVVLRAPAYFNPHFAPAYRHVCLLCGPWGASGRLKDCVDFYFPTRCAQGSSNGGAVLPEKGAILLRQEPLVPNAISIEGGRRHTVGTDVVVEIQMPPRLLDLAAREIRKVGLKVERVGEFVHGGAQVRAGGDTRVFTGTWGRPVTEPQNRVTFSDLLPGFYQARLEVSRFAVDTKRFEVTVEQAPDAIQLDKVERSGVAPNYRHDIWVNFALPPEISHLDHMYWVYRRDSLGRLHSVIERGKSGRQVRQGESMVVAHSQSAGRYLVQLARLGKVNPGGKAHAPYLGSFSWNPRPPRYVVDSLEIQIGAADSGSEIQTADAELSQPIDFLQLSPSDRSHRVLGEMFFVELPALGSRAIEVLPVGRRVPGCGTYFPSASDVLGIEQLINSTELDDYPYSDFFDQGFHSLGGDYAEYLEYELAGFPVPMVATWPGFYELRAGDARAMVEVVAEPMPGAIRIRGGPTFELERRFSVDVEIPRERTLTEASLGRYVIHSVRLGETALGGGTSPPWYPFHVLDTQTRGLSSSIAGPHPANYLKNLGNTMDTGFTQSAQEEWWTGPVVGSYELRLEYCRREGQGGLWPHMPCILLDSAPFTVVYNGQPSFASLGLESVSLRNDLPLADSSWPPNGDSLGEEALLREGCASTDLVRVEEPGAEPELRFVRWREGAYEEVIEPIEFGQGVYVQVRLEKPSSKGTYSASITIPGDIEQEVVLYPVEEDLYLMRSELLYFVSDTGASSEDLGN